MVVAFILAFCMTSSISSGFFLPEEAKNDEENHFYYPSQASIYDPFEYSKEYDKVAKDLYGHFKLSKGQKAYVFCSDKRFDPRNNCRPFMKRNFIPKSSSGSSVQQRLDEDPIKEPAESVVNLYDTLRIEQIMSCHSQAAHCHIRTKPFADPGAFPKRSQNSGLVLV